jgi:hypothetical protein
LFAVAALPPLGDQEYVNGPVPPAGVTVALPFVPLKQVMSVEAIVALIGEAVVIVAVCVVVQLLASVIVTV